MIIDLLRLGLGLVLVSWFVCLGGGVYFTLKLLVGCLSVLSLGFGFALFVVFISGLFVDLITFRLLWFVVI